MIIKKTMEVTVDIDNARKMLKLAGYYDVDSKTDEEVFNLAISMNDCYAVTCKELSTLTGSEVVRQVAEKTRPGIKEFNRTVDEHTAIKKALYQKDYQFDKRR